MTGACLFEKKKRLLILDINNDCTISFGYDRIRENQKHFLVSLQVTDSSHRLRSGVVRHLHCYSTLYWCHSPQTCPPLAPGCPVVLATVSGLS